MAPKFCAVAIFVVVAVVAVVAADSDVCSLPKDAGRCRALKPHFYFNTETK
jgi:hypothetical protein